MNPQDLGPDPIHAFSLWLEEAVTRSGLEFPHATALATVAKTGRPSVRMVLFKGLSDGDFTFFTHFESRKARELAENPFAALCFYWEKTGSQIRVEGRVSKLGAEESDAYFRSRPRGSRIGAWASPQSQPLPSREALEERVRDAEIRFHGVDDIPRPERWGGFRLSPDRLEFWRNGVHRLHDRVEFTRNGGGRWISRRLAP